MGLERYHPTTTHPVFGLPGTHILQLEARSLHDLTQQLEMGLLHETVTRLLMLLELTPVTFQQHIGLHLFNRRKNQRLTARASERVYRYACLFERAMQLTGTQEAARTWLKTPNAALGGETPLQYARTELGGQLVQHLITALEDGVVV
ncbi:antitoxin Xre/MbcA/ParS toxin-binding domain-containing protein [Deinococcus roseus]|uniref:Antitoxin Xre/MbcA/ParS-like toxin-binding domain-containing protein n=1 Tax=Deinococcus roseus TaxID=392414 RepID=A0ABQ2DIM6_9DEIO|nr:antitoxin Xre/MbcA/ParS toxin-binding domain-containing protein [Deinococcus roseus]GGJ58992.1 hypothetical protein GCM10008938_51300 [Deinococcus roseus]